MTLLKYLAAALLCTGAFAQSSTRPVLACNMKAISSTERTRYNALLEQIKAGVTNPREIGDGYVWDLNGARASLKDAAEWAMLERRCCPFLIIQLEATGSGPDYRIYLKGPEGVKAFLISEFGVGQK